MNPVYDLVGRSSEAASLFKQLPPCTRAARRPRTVPSTSKACSACRQAKAKCDEARPCTRCIRISSKLDGLAPATAETALTTCVLEALVHAAPKDRPCRTVVSQACAACRRSKVKCDEGRPCSRCIKYSWRLSTDACVRSRDPSVPSRNDLSRQSSTDTTQDHSPESPSNMDQHMVHQHSFAPYFEFMPSEAALTTDQDKVTEQPSVAAQQWHTSSKKRTHRDSLTFELIEEDLFTDPNPASFSTLCSFLVLLVFCFLPLPIPHPP
jgi:hypothetical protein